VHRSPRPRTVPSGSEAMDRRSNLFRGSVVAVEVDCTATSLAEKKQRDDALCPNDRFLFVHTSSRASVLLAGHTSGKGPSLIHVKQSVPAERLPLKRLPLTTPVAFVAGCGTSRKAVGFRRWLRPPLTVLPPDLESYPHALETSFFFRRKPRCSTRGCGYVDNLLYPQPSPRNVDNFGHLSTGYPQF
jgi:hypothetical protein